MTIYMLSEHIRVAYKAEISKTNPLMYNNFQDNLHIVRRSDHFCADLYSDLVIKQVLMRSIKTTRGLSRWRGFTDAQRAVWLLLIPATSEVNQLM